MASHPDAITLDLGDGVPAAFKAQARTLIRDAEVAAYRTGAEVFVRVNKDFLFADLAASVWPGLSGIMLPQVDCPEDVVEVSNIIGDLERERGIAKGSLQIIVVLSSGRAIWDVRNILKASRRIRQVTLNEGELAFALGINPERDIDPFVYARGRMIIEGTALNIRPVGITYPNSCFPRRLKYDEILKESNIARNLGMKGVICPHVSWVDPVNTAFTPTPELVAYNKRVREAFAAGVAAGTAAVPLDGRMIDVPVDEWAKVVLETAEACVRRDREKLQIRTAA